MNEKKLAIENFKDLCRHEFKYLVTDFGFQEHNAPLKHFENEFKIKFTRIDLQISIEGINYGSASMMSIQDSRGRKIFVELLNPEFKPFRKKKRKGQPAGQIEDIKREARLLYKYGLELLKGDFSVFEHAFERVANVMKYIEENSAK
jgi:hypothetical protein